MRTARGSIGLIAVCAVSLVACGDESTGQGDAIVVRDSAGIEIVSNDLLRLDGSCSIAATPTVSIGEEDGGEEYLLASVSGARRLSDGSIVLANARSWQLRWYDANGQYIRSAGRQGEGPGEFRQPYTLFRLDGDTLLAGDIRPLRFLRFTPDGQWVRTVDVQPMMINSPNFLAVLGDGRMLFGLRNLPESWAEGQMQDTWFTVTMHRPDGVMSDTVIARLPSSSSGVFVAGSNFTVGPLFDSYAHVNAADDVIVLAHGSERELRIHSAGDGFPLTRLIRWTGPNREVQQSDVDAERARIRKRYPPGMSQFMESELHPNRPIAKVFPAMNGIRMGTDGRIWIREYFQSGDSTRSWLAFDKDGRFDCRLTTPNFGQYHEFGPDYVLVTHEDSLGVERVKLFELRRGS